jgi:hypothetical protein
LKKQVILFVLSLMEDSMFSLFNLIVSGNAEWSLMEDTWEKLVFIDKSNERERTMVWRIEDEKREEIQKILEVDNQISIDFVYCSNTKLGISEVLFLSEVYFYLLNEKAGHRIKKRLRSVISIGGLADLSDYSGRNPRREFARFNEYIGSNPVLRCQWVLAVQKEMPGFFRHLLHHRTQAANENV